MKKKENVIIIIVAVICILLIFIVMIFVTNELKSKNNSNTILESTKMTKNTTLITTKSSTTKTTTTTTTSAPIDMQKLLKENGFELFNKDDIDYTKKLKTYTIDMSLNDFKELNYENISKVTYPDNWKFSKDKIELSGFSDNARLTILNNYEKALYKESLSSGDSPIYDIIIFYPDQKIRFFHTDEYCDNNYAVEKTVNYVNNNEVYYNFGLSFYEASCSESELSGMYLKNNNWDYYNLVDNNIVYKEDLIKNVIWHGASIIITNQNEVYYRSKKVENLKFLALIYEEDLGDGFINNVGIISSDYYYYQFNDGKLKRKKIKNIYISKKEITNRISKPHIIMEFEDGTYSDDKWLTDYVADINYLKNL